MEENKGNYTHLFKHPFSYIERKTIFLQSAEAPISSTNALLVSCFLLTGS